MSKIIEDSLRIQFKTGDLINVTWLKNHAHLSQNDINELVEAGVLTLIKKDPSDRMADDKYILN